MKVTAKMKEELLDLYKERPFEEGNHPRQCGIEDTLDILGVKIDGINDYGKKSLPKNETITPLEQIQMLLSDVKRCSEDIQGTDLEYFDKKDLKELSKECRSLADLCDSTVESMDECEIE